MENVFTIDDIEILFAKILTKLRIDGIKQFHFENDKYWVILTEEWVNFDKVPEPAVGSLTDDINYLRLVAQGELSVSYLELERLASVLLAVSEILRK
jgi:hypothetical protein